MLDAVHCSLRVLCTFPVSESWNMPWSGMRRRGEYMVAMMRESCGLMISVAMSSEMKVLCTLC